MLGRRYVHQASTSSLQCVDKTYWKGFCAFFSEKNVLCVCVCLVCGVKDKINAERENMLHGFLFVTTRHLSSICVSCSWLIICVWNRFWFDLINIELSESMPLMRDWAVKE